MNTITAKLDQYDLDELRLITSIAERTLDGKPPRKLYKREAELCRAGIRKWRARIQTWNEMNDGKFSLEANSK